MIFTGAILTIQQHQMLDVVRREKEKLSVRTDIALPKEILEQISSSGWRIGEDHKISIDLTYGDNNLQ